MSGEYRRWWKLFAYCSEQNEDEHHPPLWRGPLPVCRPLCLGLVQSVVVRWWFVVRCGVVFSTLRTGTCGGYTLKIDFTGIQEVESVLHFPLGSREVAILIASSLGSFISCV